MQYFLPLGLSGRRGIVVTHVRPSFRLSVCLSSCNRKLFHAISQKRIDGSSPNLHTRCILASLSSLLFLRGQDQRSRSPEVKNLDRPYLENYWANSNSGLKARQRSNIKSTFSVKTQKLLVVATCNKNHWIPLVELHKIVARHFFRPTHRFRYISNFVPQVNGQIDISVITQKLSVVST